MTSKNTELEVLITDIAISKLSIQSLETRNSDSLDFYNVPVWGLRDALLEAVELGRRLEREKPRQVHQD
jgi:hypothetical protein